MLWTLWIRQQYGDAVGNTRGPGHDRYSVLRQALQGSSFGNALVNLVIWLVNPQVRSDELSCYNIYYGKDCRLRPLVVLQTAVFPLIKVLSLTCSSVEPVFITGCQLLVFGQLHCVYLFWYFQFVRPEIGWETS